MSRAASATSKSVQPSSTRLIRSSLPTKSAPACSALRAPSPSAKTSTRDGLAQAVGQQRGAAELLVGVTRVKAGAQVQLDGLVELGGRGLLGQGDRLFRRVGLVLRFA